MKNPETERENYEDIEKDFIDFDISSTSPHEEKLPGFLSYFFFVPSYSPQYKIIIFILYFFIFFILFFLYFFFLVCHHFFALLLGTCFRFHFFSHFLSHFFLFIYFPLSLLFISMFDCNKPLHETRFDWY